MPRGKYRRYKGGKMRGDIFVPRGFELAKDGTLVKMPVKKNKTYYRKKAQREALARMMQRGY